MPRVRTNFKEKYFEALVHIRELEYKLGFALRDFEMLKGFVGDEAWGRCLDAEQEKWQQQLKGNVE